MLVRLSRNVYVRHFGGFTYVLNRLDSSDMVFKDAELFFKWLTREPSDETEVVRNICDEYDESDDVKDGIANDVKDFLEALELSGCIVRGESRENLDSRDKMFSYDDGNPSTLNLKHGWERFGENLPATILENYYKENPALFSLQIEITEACTERCLHCYIPDYNPVFMPFAIFEKIVNEFRAQGGIQISLSGGECMLHPEFSKFIRCITDNDMIATVLSNLTLCDQEKLELLKSSGASVQVSLYSMNPYTHDWITRRKGSFEATIGCIRKLRENNIPCCISCPTMKQNCDDYIDVLEFAKGMNMDAQTDFIIMAKRNCENDNLSCRMTLEQTRHVIEDIVTKSLPVNEEYFSRGKKSLLQTDEEWETASVCGGGVSVLSVDAHGDYHPCPALGGIVLGNCYKHTLEWVLKRSPETKRIRAIRGRHFKKCVHCVDRDYCCVCMCRNYNETGDLFTPAQHFCDGAKINHEVVDEFQKKQELLTTGIRN